MGALKYIENIPKKYIEGNICIKGDKIYVYTNKEFVLINKTEANLRDKLNEITYKALKKELSENESYYDSLLKHLKYDYAERGNFNCFILLSPEIAEKLKNEGLTLSKIETIEPGNIYYYKISWE